MGKLLRRWWRYVTALLTGKFEERADPKIQIQQAIEEAERQHKLLTQQAANVIAHQKDTEIQLNRAIDNVEKLAASSRQALIMADNATKAGNAADAAKYNQAAQAFAQRLIVAEGEVESLKAIHLQATDAARQAKAAVNNNRMALEKKYTEKTKLLSQLDQAKMQERMTAAMQSMTSTVGEDVPTLDEVRRKIEQRYAHALGAAELQSESVEAKMLEVEQASVDMEAQVRLDEIRKQLGLDPATPEAVPGPAQPQVAAPTQADPAQVAQPQQQASQAEGSGASS
jgi:phage shock protein A